MLIKKGCFPDIEILEIYQRVNWEEYQQDPSTQTETLNVEKKNPP